MCAGRWQAANRSCDVMNIKNLSLVSLHQCREAAGALFERLAADAAVFHPHPMTAQFAHSLTWKNDVYTVGLADNYAVAYGILRGWDAGFSIPSLGVAVSPDVRGFGLCRLMMEYLHACARLRGCQSIRLKVYPHNHRAKDFYTKLGYAWKSDLEAGQLIGILDLRR